MSLLSDAQITAMRSTAELALPGTATIQRATPTSDSGGGHTDAWADLATVACRIAPVGGGEGHAVGDAVDDRTTHVVTVPAGQDVTEADRLMIDSTTYAITLVRTRGEWELTRRIEVREST